MSPSGSLAKVKQKGKKPKTFIESKDTALELASVIAGTVEEKSNERAAKNRHVYQTPVRSDPKARSASREKLKQVKDSLKAEKARAKREKSKARRREAEGETSRSSAKNAASSDTSNRKRVAFA
ncbi:hypothetical protein BC629DRAFT_1589569 [Irpex lacteus]|nr:hypothetical protein BC629DRAFT_1589569 [Irpex lacteus]